MAKEVVLSEREEAFVDALVESGGNIQHASEVSGYAPKYCYLLKNKFAKQVAEATQIYLTLHAPKAAKHVIDTLSEPVPNPIRLNAARDILDRAGVKPMVEEEEKQVIKANIFILPEKKYAEIIEADFEISQ